MRSLVMKQTETPALRRSDRVKGISAKGKSIVGTNLAKRRILQSSGRVEKNAGARLAEDSPKDEETDDELDVLGSQTKARGAVRSLCNAIIRVRKDGSEDGSIVQISPAIPEKLDPEGISSSSSRQKSLFSASNDLDKSDEDESIPLISPLSPKGLGQEGMNSFPNRPQSLFSGLNDRPSSNVVPVLFPSPETAVENSAPRGPAPTHIRYVHLQPPQFQKHQTFWFPDGSLFIQLEKMRFRLHKSRLARASNFFEELFRLRDALWENEVLEISLESGDSADVAVDVEEVHGMDLYFLDNIGVSLIDFEVFMNVLDNGVRYSANEVPFSTLASAIRAATTFKCPFVCSWAIAGIEKQSTPPTFLEPIPDAAQSFVLARKYNMDKSGIIMTRALYELLRMEEVTDVAHLSIPKDRFLEARRNLKKAWLAVAKHSSDSAVTCPLESASAVTTQQCISHSLFEVRRVHQELVYPTLWDRYCCDPIGILEVLMSMDEQWAAAGYCLVIYGQRKKSE
ncbi:hypothetical protein FB451DRAFT_1369566 [Mycena latifolia]|nr:hypothetical protein FB451DRAFT_1369566 [Mycena latifolia]